MFAHLFVDEPKFCASSAPGKTWPAVSIWSLFELPTWNIIPLVSSTSILPVYALSPLFLKLTDPVLSEDRPITHTWFEELSADFTTRFPAADEVAPTSNLLPSQVKFASPFNVAAVPDPVITLLSALLLIVTPDIPVKLEPSPYNVSA